MVWQGAIGRMGNTTGFSIKRGRRLGSLTLVVGTRSVVRDLVALLRRVVPVGTVVAIVFAMGSFVGIESIGIVGIAGVHRLKGVHVDSNIIEGFILNVHVGNFKFFLPINRHGKEENPFDIVVGQLVICWAIWELIKNAEVVSKVSQELCRSAITWLFDSAEVIQLIVVGVTSEREVLESNDGGIKVGNGMVETVDGIVPIVKLNSREVDSELLEELGTCSPTHGMACLVELG